MQSNPLPVAISGYGSISAAGSSAETGYTSVKEGRVHNRNIGGELFPEDYEAPCFQVELDDEFLIDNKQGQLFRELEGANRTILLAFTAILQALDVAELTIDQLQQKRVGIALGTTVGCTFHNEDYYRTWRRGEVWDHTPLHTYVGANLAASIQTVLGVRGPRLVVTNACSSSTDAIGVAKHWIDTDLCEIAIAGGADELSRVACHGFKSLMLVSQETCIPFDQKRAGLNLGEGAGIMILEKKHLAAKRRSPLFGWIKGYGSGSDAYHPTAPHPQGRGLQLAVKRAMADGGVGLEDIGIVNGHGTGTQANDMAETNGLAAVGFAVENIPIVSTKGATGHTLGAAGGVEAVFTLLALNEGLATGTVGCTCVDPQLKCHVLQEGQSVSLRSRIGISQSLAFGGGNSALVIEGAGT